MRPAREYDIRFGHNILGKSSKNWGRYLVISTPSAWSIVKSKIVRSPVGLGMNNWLDRSHLIEVSDSLTNDADMVVGIGGGRALDHAKLVASRKDLPLIQVPTIVSTGAIIHGFVADWKGRVIVGRLAEVDCEYVLVDYDIIKQAPLHLNTAGLGDVLCGYSGISEWNYFADMGMSDPVDTSLTKPLLDHYEKISYDFPLTLENDHSLSDKSISYIMKEVQDRDDRMLRDPRAPAADHSFCFALEAANDKYWVHGEACALGAVIVAWHTDQSPETLVKWLDRCMVKFRPKDMKISKKELSRSLEELVTWMQRGDSKTNGNPSIMVSNPVTGDRFEECWSWLSTI
ncbi:MAG: iron-containing alcohol dehydrogenase family protein [SAR202 cluster bacterium]|nr:iron-containing alcohol dehydrogenase family protein [SAR202 cluster bacterium]